MSRAELLRDIEAIISGAGFELSNSEAPMTFKKNVSYPGLIAGKNEIAHFLLFIDRNLKPKKIKKTPKNGCLFNTACVP